MAAFSYQHYPFHLDSVFLPNTSIKNLSGFVEEGNNVNTNYSSQIYPPEFLPLVESLTLDATLDHSSLMGDVSDNELSSVTKKQSTDSSTVVDKLESGKQVTQKLNPPMYKKRKSSLNSPQSKNQKKCNIEEDKKPKSMKKDQKKVSDEEPPTGYFHVRARRGQATDSHSLAERVRREKISERMKLLQRLVPGCDKITGKALVLDEIINYVLSLQNQVEFLSMKLASVNPLFYGFGMDLDALMIRTEELNNLISSMPTATPSTGFTDATTVTNAAATTTVATANNYNPVIDTLASILMPYDFIQGTTLMWDVDERRQKFLNPSG